MNRKLKLEELNRIDINAFKGSPKSGISIVLDNIRSLSNVGSIFRTSDAFLIDKIYLCGITATPPHREIQKTALGSTDSVEWQHFESTQEALNQLKENGFKTYALEQAEGSLQLNEMAFSNTDKIAIVVGHEVNGVQQEIINACDGCIEIPQFGTKHSLNVASSASIAIWDIWSKKQRA